MNDNLHYCDIDVTALSDPECMLRDGWQISVASSYRHVFGSPPSIPHALEAALKGETAPIPKAKKENPLHRLHDRPALEKCPASRIRPTQSVSSTRLEDTVQKEIANIPSLVKHTIIRLFGDVGRYTESRLDTVAMWVIRTPMNRAVVKTLQSSTGRGTVDQAVQKFIINPHIVNVVSARIINAPAFTVPVAIFVKNKVKMCTLVQVKIKEWDYKLVKAVKEIGHSHWKTARAGHQDPRRTSATRRKPTKGHKVRGRFRESWMYAIIKNVTGMEETGNIIAAIIIVPPRLSCVSKQIWYPCARFLFIWTNNTDGRRLSVIPTNS